MKKLVNALHSTLHVFVGKERAPIRKVVAGGLAAGVVFLAHRLGLHIPVKTVDDLASEFAGVVVAYLTKA